MFLCIRSRNNIGWSTLLIHKHSEVWVIFWILMESTVNADKPLFLALWGHFYALFGNCALCCYCLFVFPISEQICGDSVRLETSISQLGVCVPTADSTNPGSPSSVPATLNNSPKGRKPEEEKFKQVFMLIQPLAFSPRLPARVLISVSCDSKEWDWYHSLNHFASKQSADRSDFDSPPSWAAV